MKKILGSVGVLALVGALFLGATGAFFSDTETSTGNTFTAGAIDLKIDSTQHYNNAVCVNGHWALNAQETATVPQYPVISTDCGGSWALKDLVPISDKFFNFADIKPGDSGEDTISLHVLNNDAYVCAMVSNLTNADNTQTEPEALVDTNGLTTGELQQTMDWKVWNDNGLNNGNGEQISGAVAGDNIYQDGEKVLASGHPSNGSLALYDSTTGAPLASSDTAYLGVSWSLPASSGNETQTDSMTGDISFQVVQARNNSNFKCSDQQAPEVHRLVLDNEVMVGDPWTTTPNDEIGGVLTWAGDGPTFDYSVTASGLPASTNYSLIYYADPYPGNFPGKLIGTGTTDVSGNLSFAGNPDLNLDLPTAPDTNIGLHGGAKIWLIPSANYNAGTNSVTPWTPDNTWLFEGNVYINYNDTNN